MRVIPETIYFMNDDQDRVLIVLAFHETQDSSMDLRRAWIYRNIVRDGIVQDNYPGFFSDALDRLTHSAKSYGDQVGEAVVTRVVRQTRDEGAWGAVPFEGRRQR
ncbi:MAG: hypothetical protein WC107_02480 [Patescibacteria group bacterium]